MLFLDIFIRFFALVIPFSTALLRFIYVVLSSHANSRSIKRWAHIIIYMTPVLSLLVALTVQLPPSDFAQGPYSFCLGRFEVYFNPQHPDPVTPGRRQGLEWCEIHYKLFVESSDSTLTEFALRFLHYFLCRFALFIYYVLILSFPEPILYAITFWRIHGSIKAAASSGILNTDVIKSRKKKNTINIYITFWAWLIQYFVNILNYLVAKLIFGKSPFLHSLFSLLQLTFNFTIMPFLYILVADENFKAFLLQKDFREAFILLFTM